MSRGRTIMVERRCCGRQGTGTKAVVRLLLATDGVDADSRDQSGRTPLSLAARHGHKVVEKLLLTMDIFDPDSKDKSGWMLPRWSEGKDRSRWFRCCLP